MARYSLAIPVAANKAEAVRLVRPMSRLGVGEIARRIGSQEPVVEFDTFGYAQGGGYEKGVPQQHALLLELISKLKLVGATVTITHVCSVGSEAVSEEMLRNLMEREVVGLQQEHD
jgi:hypothetical protein